MISPVIFSVTVSLFSSMELSAIEFLNNALTPIVPKIIALKENIGGLYDTVVNNPISSGVWDWLETGLDVVSKLIPKIQFLRGLLSSNGGTAGDGAAVGNLGLPDNTISKTTLVWCFQMQESPLKALEAVRNYDPLS